MIVSVIIPSYNASRTIERCLRSLLSQDTTCPYEIIVSDSSTDGTAELIASQFPTVRLCRSPRRLYPGAAFNRGIADARGDLLALTGADCIASSDWIQRIVEEHAAAHHVIGGAIDNANPESYLGWAYYLFEFSQWLPVGRPRLMDEIPTGCLSLKRQVFDTCGPFPEEGFCSDSVFNWRLVSAGHRPWFVPSVRVFHINPDSLIDLIRRKVRHGWYFARVRAGEKRFSFLKRGFYAAGCTVLPALLLFRILQRVGGTGPYLREFVQAFPVVALSAVTWSLGEAVGYLSTPLNSLNPKSPTNRPPTS